MVSGFRVPEFNEKATQPPVASSPMKEAIGYSAYVNRVQAVFARAHRIHTLNPTGAIQGAISGSQAMPYEPAAPNHEAL